jgi:hypothetical protein
MYLSILVEHASYVFLITFNNMKITYSSSIDDNKICKIFFSNEINFDIKSQIYKTNILLLLHDRTTFLQKYN